MHSVGNCSHPFGALCMPFFMRVWLMLGVLSHNFDSGRHCRSVRLIILRGPAIMVVVRMVEGWEVVWGW